ncbi:LysR family transcriptional regulator [Devosia rhodophyticola]|uniref:LysR family transcriptional regulator n=1 Tax=Devosia rhodophyticola TaxID=3026423 RepID=A0ABY7YTD2_9HYPH|nr:LysR family transcriptional regulator [Devosia rhodophyticola]WDR04571.1 LysR family transcriptional regulator [Devosia rhodophyticola]
MTLEQLEIFVAVAEREHLTNAAHAIGLTPSAVSASIKALETFHDVHLFERVGRRIEITAAGRAFLVEAKTILARVRTAELVLSELSQLHRGTLAVHASQTIASYWLPSRLMQFRTAFPGIDIRLHVGNTETVAQAVLDGLAEIGFAEGDIENAALATEVIAKDIMVIVARPDHPLATARSITASDLLVQTQWIAREPGSGTRAALEQALRDNGCDPAKLQRSLVLPSNEAVLAAVAASNCAAAVSLSAAAHLLDQGELAIIDFALPTRAFHSVRHKERRHGEAVRQLQAICAGTFVAGPRH